MPSGRAVQLRTLMTTLAKVTGRLQVVERFARLFEGANASNYGPDACGGDVPIQIIGRRGIKRSKRRRSPQKADVVFGSRMIEWLQYPTQTTLIVRMHPGRHRKEPRARIAAQPMYRSARVAP
jgi:hypothetical protein